jgi:hypothetical protein
LHLSHRQSVPLLALASLLFAGLAYGEASFRQPYPKPEDANNDAVLRQLNQSLPLQYRVPSVDGVPVLQASSHRCVFPDKFTCPTDRDDTILNAQIGLVATHDASLLIGLLPFPAISIAAELVSLGSNLGLKVVPPFLRAPLDRTVDPFPARDGNGFAADSCGIGFELLSPQASYSNLFGLVPLPAPYVSVKPFRIAPWLRVGVEDYETRWGYLRNPLIYHANTDAELSVGINKQVRRWQPGTETFSEPFAPLDSFAEEPQTVYLPIGTHEVNWRAATQISPLFDVIVDGVMAASSIRAEKEAIKGGVVASKRAAVVLSPDAAASAISKKSDTRFNRFLLKFKEKLRAAFKKQGDGPLSKLVKKEAKKVATEIVRDEILETLIEVGVECLNEYGETDLNIIQRRITDVVQDVYLRNYSFGESLCIGPDFVYDNLNQNIDDIITGVLEADDNDLIFKLFSLDTTVTNKTQTVTVYDSLPPEVTLTGAPYVLRATDFGGTRLSRSRNDLLEHARQGVRDNCGQQPIITMEADEFLLLGDNVVTYTFQDAGPNPVDPSKDFAPTFEQIVRVEDNEPPLLLVPPPKIVLSAVDVDRVDADIGTAVAIDLVDPNPAVDDDAPVTFPAASRTEVNWTATDGSGNVAMDAQLVTIKETNLPPTAMAPPLAATTTAVSVPIRLEASDPDVVGGRADPLWFDIVERPKRGEFIAPLYPFFVNDFRVRPDDALDGYDPTQDTPGANYLNNLIRTTYCSTSPEPPGGRIVPRDWVNNGTYVEVDDDGIWYVWDSYYECLANDDSGLNESPRISRWDQEGNYLGQLSIGAGINPTEEAFQLDQNGKLYYSSLVDPGGSEQLHLNGCAIDQSELNPDGSYRCTDNDLYRFEPSGTPLPNNGLRYVRIDSTRNLGYLYTDDDRVWLFRVFAHGGTEFIGEVGPLADDGSGDVRDNWLGNAPTMAVDSKGNLYVPDEDRHRIHKFGAPQVNADGELEPGPHIGWMGRCDSTDNNACEFYNGVNRSRGYSCTDDTCGVDADLFGSEQGQFNMPRYIALDPNDVLYVADYDNFRVQRFATDGSFAGEAKSTGTGVNSGDEPSFILGNMGQPASISVNSNQFFVIDREENFVHIFSSLPFTDMGDDWAEVRYVSHQDFPNPLSVDDDSFTFSASDGLEDSNIATAVVRVSRNYRPPEDLGTVTEPEHGCPEPVWRSSRSGCLEIELDEDTSVAFELTSYDPDGIVGVDFLGLDSVTYTVLRVPRFGTISGAGANWVYTPNENFYGRDRLIFKANDGQLDSEPATLWIDVLPVNDPPVVNVELRERIALGFPTSAMAVFTDDISPQYWADVWWGDGDSEGTGEYVEDAEGNWSIDGVVINPPPQEGYEGRAIADHVFTTEGEFTVRMCIEDDGVPFMQGCNIAIATVTPLVSIAVSGEASGELIPGNEDTTDEDYVFTMEYEDEFADGADFDVEATVSNGEREGGGGLVAEGMHFEMQLPENLLIRGFNIAQGSCTQTDLSVSCDVGDMNPGQDVLFILTAAGPGDLVYDTYYDFEAVLSTTSEAVENDLPLRLSALLIADITDSDGDGMSDAFETAYGFDLAVDDSAEDPDGDGLSNLREFEEGTSPHEADTDGDGINDFDEVEAGMNPLADDNPPELQVPEDIHVIATGLLSAVDLGTATATDHKDGAVEPEVSDAGPFAPGVNIVTWSAVDSAGNRVRQTQRVEIVPLLNFAVDQIVPEGVTAAALLELNGEAVEYPVSVPYTVSGTAMNPGDHDAVNGVALIESGRAVAIEINVAADLFAEPDKTVVLTLGTPQNAAAGSSTVHTVTISEQNAAPRVGMYLEQQGRRTTTVASSGGLTGVLSQVLDNPLDMHSFDWSASDSGLFDPITVNDPAYLLDPAGLADGMYNLRLSVTDDGIPPLNTQASSLVKVVFANPVLSVNDDSDRDGLNDADDGTGDEDADRIANYLDRHTAVNVLPFGEDGRLLETENGLQLRLGGITFELTESHAGVDEQSVLVDEDNGFPTDVADFEIAGLPPGGQARVVVPLEHPVAASAFYRQYAQMQWLPFDASGSDELASADGSAGACPAPGANAFAAGLQTGAWCLQLTLTDGGPNDSDGVADGVIRHAGGLAAPVSVRTAGLPNPEVRLSGPGSIVVVRFSLQSDSGDAMLRSIDIQSTVPGDTTPVERVLLVIDTNTDGRLTTTDVTVAQGSFLIGGVTQTLVLDEPFAIPPGETQMLIVLEVPEGG